MYTTGVLRPGHTFSQAWSARIASKGRRPVSACTRASQGHRSESAHTCPSPSSCPPAPLPVPSRPNHKEANQTAPFFLKRESLPARRETDVRTRVLHDLSRGQRAPRPPAHGSLLAGRLSAAEIGGQASGGRGCCAGTRPRALIGCRENCSWVAEISRVFEGTLLVKRARNTSLPSHTSSAAYSALPLLGDTAARPGFPP